MSCTGKQHHHTTAQLQISSVCSFVKHTWFCKSNWSTCASGRPASAQANADMGTLTLNQPPGAVCAGAVALVRGSLPQYWFDSVFLSSIFSTGSCGAGSRRSEVGGATKRRMGLTLPTKLEAAGVRTHTCTHTVAQTPSTQAAQTRKLRHQGAKHQTHRSGWVV